MTNNLSDGLKGYLSLLEHITLNHPSIDRALFQCCQFLQDHLDHYDWVGFYFMNDAKQMLHLGPFAGAPTEHKLIPYGKGICGQVAESGKSLLIEDVNAEENYIACSLETKSEIVVPIFHKGVHIGQIDVDSHQAKAFNHEDEQFLKAWTAQILSYAAEDLLAYRDRVINRD